MGLRPKVQRSSHSTGGPFPAAAEPDLPLPIDADAADYHAGLFKSMKGWVWRRVAGNVFSGGDLRRVAGKAVVFGRGGVCAVVVFARGGVCAAWRGRLLFLGGEGFVPLLFLGGGRLLPLARQSLVRFF